MVEEVLKEAAVVQPKEGNEMFLISKDYKMQSQE
jgi:hypothetical protein